MPTPALVLGDEPAYSIFSRLESPSQVCCCSSVSSEWRGWLNDERIWKGLCHTHYQLRVLRGCDGAECTTWKNACCSWYKHGFGDGKRSAELRLRSLDVWTDLCGWFQKTIPDVIDTIGSGAPAAEWNAVCETLDIGPDTVSLEAVRCVYEVHNGQQPIHTHDDWSELCKGLLGGFSAYDSKFCTWLLPLKTVLELNEILHGMQGAREIFEHKMVFCTSPAIIDVRRDLNTVSKFFAVDVRNGSISILQLHTQTWLPCTPVVTDDTGGMTFPRRPDQIILWLAELVRRTQCGMHLAARLIPDDPETEGLNLFPISGPNFSSAVTKGILVEGRSLYNASEDHWCYSLRIRLLKPDEEGYLSPEERKFTTCQLERRQWEIEENGHTSHVDGLGVIGKYPLLFEGGWRDDQQEQGGSEGDTAEGENCEGTFVYQSCTGSACTFGGRVMFVPGSRDEPTGEAFYVDVARFACDVPSYVY